MIVGGEGPDVIDASGNRHLDFHSGWGHFSLGQQPLAIVQAAATQFQQLANVTPGFVHAPAAVFAARLAQVTLGNLVKAFFSTVGSESVDIAVKLARAYTGRAKIVACYRSYQGNNYSAGVLSGDPRRLPLELGLPGVVYAQDCYRCPFKLEYPICDVYCADHIADVIELEGPNQVAAVIAEPSVTGNGCLVPPPAYWLRLRKIFDRYGVLLIAAEVVTRFGRTGQRFACDHWNVVPDIMVLAKDLTADLQPLGAVVMRAALADYFEDHYLPAGLNYQAHPVACAAALAAIETIEYNDLMENACLMGARLLAGLVALRQRHPAVGDLRGLRLYGTLELVRNRATRELLAAWHAPAAHSGGTQELNWHMLERGVRVAVRWNRMHVAPPLIAGEAEIDEGLAAIDYALVAADELYTG